MKRRRFFLAGAGAGLLSQWKSPLAILAATPDEPKDNLMMNTISGTASFIDSNRLRGRNRDRSTVACRRGVCATSQPVAACVGADLLKSGGNAVDAAVAMSAMMSVVEPMSCGPGGDLFVIVWIEKDRKLYGLNASGRSPFAWNRDEAIQRGYSTALPEIGPHTWSVPGCVSGWDALLKRFGRRSFKEVLVPAAECAREGFVVTEIIGGYFQGADKAFREFPSAAQTYLQNGKPPQYGQVFANRDLSKFYDLLIRDGAEEFYRGEIAERIVNYSQERGGYFSKRDFEEHRADWVEPVSTNYRGYDVWEIPPNGQGIAALQMLNMLETFAIGSLQPNSAAHLHLFIEAKKLAFEDRSLYYADMERAEVPLADLISKEYGQQRAQLIDLKRAAANVKPGAMDGSHDTIYLCAADGEGNMVSLIQSIYSGFGSREVPTGLGFCLQNRGRAFSLDPKHRNSLEPHKRPFHTIIPGFVTKEGTPKCAFGVMGGDMQPQGHVQVLMNLIDFKMSPQQAGEQPRVEHYGSSNPWGGSMTNGGSIGLEAGVSDETARQLEAMGHTIEERGTGMYGGYQAIWREDEPLRYFAGSDPRKDGGAVGF